MLDYRLAGIAIAGLMSIAPCAAQSDTPGVRQVAPGVTEIDGSKVPSITLDTAALEEAIKSKKSFRAAARLLGGKGIVYPGPGSVTHMYKVRDSATKRDLVVILFVNGDTILDYLIR